MNGSGNLFPSTYDLERAPDGWKAFDVVIDNISLVTNYRDEFDNCVEEAGVDGLINTLADKNGGAAPGN